MELSPGFFFYFLMFLSVPSAQCLEADGLELLPESLLSNYPSGFPDFLCAVELESLLGWSSSALWAGL